MTTKITEKNISNLANAGVDWQSVFTGDGSTGLTAVAGRGYFIDTTSGTVEVTLPASPSTGDVVVLKDYARTWNTNNVTTNSVLSDGDTSANTFSTNGQTVTLVYMDGTKGWSLINEDTTSKLEIPAIFIAATGGTVTESGDYKIHTFTGDGCFVVSSVGNNCVQPLGGPDTVDYLVVAGGGAGGSLGGGGGGGGYRESAEVCAPWTASPIASSTSIPVSVSSYPITVGAGGSPGPANCRGGDGSNSSFSTIISAGGGGGGGHSSNSPGNDGGSGGGGGFPGGPTEGGSGNTPPVSPPQGSDGGGGQAANTYSGGGGGATEAGQTSPGSAGGRGGAGATTSISGSPFSKSGGGGGGINGASPGCAGAGSPCGTGKAGIKGGSTPGPSAGANTGGGGGGGAHTSSPPIPSKVGGAGGSGIVIIRYKYQ